VTKDKNSNINGKNGVSRRQFTGAAVAGAAALPIVNPLRLDRAQKKVRVVVLLPR